MHSPFPGHDPFLERYWKDYHASFGGFAKGVLNPGLPPDLFVGIETDVYIHELSAEERLTGLRRKIVGDGVVHTSDPVPKAETATAVMTRPTAVGRLPGVEEEVTKKVVIRTIEGEEVVTVIELLSLTNKIRHRDAYLVKRAALLESPAHLVEIDLLRAGRRFEIEDCPDSDYLVTVSAAGRRPEVDLFAFDLREALPILPIPLRDGKTVPLDLRLVMDRVYDASEYERRIYRRPPDPPLPPADAAWAAGVLTDAGLPLPPGYPPHPAPAPE